MSSKDFTKPDYAYSLETLSCSQLAGQSFFTFDVSIIKAIQGTTVLEIDGKEHSFLSGTHFILVDGLFVRILSCSQDFKALRCRFTMQFMNQVYPNLDAKTLESLNFSSPEFCLTQKNYLAEDLLPENSLANLADLTFQQLCALQDFPNLANQHRISINLLLNYIFLISPLIIKKSENKLVSHQVINQTISDFLALCIKYSPEERNIDFYAQKLNVSPRHLYTLVKENLNASPKEVIDYYVIGNAKKILLSTNLNNQQIADQLNFPDQGTFSQFFKRNVGLSPSEFRKLG